MHFCNKLLSSCLLSYVHNIIDFKEMSIFSRNIGTEYLSSCWLHTTYSYIKSYPPLQICFSGKYSRNYFNRNGELRHIRHLRFWPLERVLVEKYSLSESDSREFTAFLLPLLDFSSSGRVTAGQALAHPWLKSEGRDEEGVGRRDGSKAAKAGSEGLGIIVDGSKLEGMRVGSQGEGSVRLEGGGGKGEGEKAPWPWEVDGEGKGRGGEGGGRKKDEWRPGGVRERADVRKRGAAMAGANGGVYGNEIRNGVQIRTGG